MSSTRDGFLFDDFNLFIAYETGILQSLANNDIIFTLPITGPASSMPRLGFLWDRLSMGESKVSVIIQLAWT
jgi:hypothetical protein